MGRKEDHVRVTLAEVAADAGVSTAAASLILRQQQAYVDHFRPETVQKVFESARKLGYRSNLFALSLAATKSSFLGLVLHTPARGQLNGFLTKVNVDDLLAGTVEAASAADVYPIIRMAGLQAEESTIRSIVDLIGGGVFATLVQTPSAELEEAVRDRLMHDNLVGLVFPRRYSAWEFNAIDADNVRIGEIAAQLLTLQGRRRLAVVYDDSGCEGLTVRQESLIRAADEAGIPVESIIVPCGTDHLRICDVLAAELKRSHLDGLFAPTLIGSFGAILACRQLGLMPGQDLAIIGSDCLQWPAESLPQVTSVDVSWNDAGKIAAQRMLELREGGEHRFDNILLSPRVIPGSTCPVPDGFAGVELPPVPPLDSTAAL